MKKIILALILVLQPLLVFAGQPLSKSVITSFYSASGELDKLETKYPKEFNRMDDFSLSQKAEIIDFMKSSKAYPDISSVLSKNRFSSVEGFLDISVRLMGSLYKVQLQKMPEESRQQLKMMEQSFDDNIKMMRQKGMPESMIAGMKVQLQDMKKHQTEMKKAAKLASPADVKFVNDNFDWIMKIVPNDGYAEEYSGGMGY